jgi:hypothetical protein
MLRAVTILNVLSVFAVIVAFCTAPFAMLVLLLTGMEVPPTCLECGEQVESLLYLLFTAPFAMVISTFLGVFFSVRCARRGHELAPFIAGFPLLVATAYSLGLVHLVVDMRHFLF